jgi:hypothetical protein
MAVTVREGADLSPKFSAKAIPAEAGIAIGFVGYWFALAFESKATVS